MIIFVCKANYCRSPVAERLLKHLRPDLNVISRGIINFTRMSMDPRSMKYLELKNINSTQHQPTKIDMQTIENASLLIIFDYEIFEYFRSNYKKYTNKLKLINYVDKSIKIPDPYILKDDKEYLETMENINILVNSWAKQKDLDK